MANNITAYVYSANSILEVVVIEFDVGSGPETRQPLEAA